MTEPLLSRREWTIWIALLVVVSALLILTRFASDDPDSALYAAIAAHSAQGPASHWIVPQWWALWPDSGEHELFREHPAGVFLIPAALGRLGLPAAQTSYIVGIAAGLGSLLFAAVLIQRLTSRADARAALVLLPFMPLAFIFRIRANHEYPMLVCMLAMLVGLDSVRRRWTWGSVALVAIALTAALLVKGVFVVLLFLAAGWWIVLNPAGARGSIVAPIAACAIAIVVMAGVAVAYDAEYLRVTGEHFWLPYWQRQLGPLTLATPLDQASTLVGHLGFYALRLLWHPAPWSFALLAACWRIRGRAAAWWRRSRLSERRGLLFVLGYALLAVGLLSPASRFAERYAFSATYLIGAAGAVVAVHIWPWLRAKCEALDARVVAFPAIVWAVLILLRLVFGPFLPRIGA
jgi:4-amino-4-deoxy-L-arabinose transferase-like glycosyltransferase